MLDFCMGGFGAQGCVIDNVIGVVLGLLVYFLAWEGRPLHIVPCPHAPARSRPHLPGVLFELTNVSGPSLLLQATGRDTLH